MTGQSTLRHRWKAGIAVLFALQVALQVTFSREARSEDPVKPGAPPADNRKSAAGSLPPDLSTRPGDDWPQFLGPTGDSKSRETGIVAPWPKAGPRIVWQKPLDIGYGIGSVSRGRYFHFDRRGDQAMMVCLHAETGEEIWRKSYDTDYVDFYDYNGGPLCSPVVDGDRVYFYGVEGMLVCLKAADGAMLWKVDTSNEFGVVQNFFGVGSTPVVEGDLLLAMVGGSPRKSHEAPPGALDLVEPNGSAVVAFDKFTGEVKYKVGDDLASYASLRTASIDGRQWAFAFARQGLLAFEPASGKIDFHYPWRAKSLESVNASVPVVAGNEVLISETYGPGSSLLAVRPGGYDIVWKDDLRKREKALQTHWNTPVFHEGYAYASSGRHLGTAELRCIEWKSGKVQWSVPDLTRCSLLYVDGQFVCQCEDGRLILFKADSKSFQPVSDVMFTRPGPADTLSQFGPPRLLKPPCWAAPILARGLLYVRGDDRLVCLELIPPADR
jgi:outer membrane protein assembly factor BamB